MSQKHIFTPVYGTGITVAPTDTSGSTTVSRASKQKQYVVTNLGSQVVYVRAGVGSATATTADYPVLPDTQVVLTKDYEADTFAYITASGIGSVHIISGEGF